MQVYHNVRSTDYPVDYHDRAHRYVFKDIHEVQVPVEIDEEEVRTEYESTMYMYDLNEPEISIDDLAEAIDILAGIVLAESED